MSQKLLLGLVLGLTGVGAVICGVNLHKKIEHDCGVNLHKKIEHEDSADFNNADFE